MLTNKHGWIVIEILDVIEGTDVKHCLLACFEMKSASDDTHSAFKIENNTQMDSRTRF